VGVQERTRRRDEPKNETTDEVKHVIDNIEQRGKAEVDNKDVLSEFLFPDDLMKVIKEWERVFQDYHKK